MLQKDKNPVFNFYIPGEFYSPDYLGGKSYSDTSESQAATVKKLMKKSGGMLGTGQNGIIQEAISGGVLRLNWLEKTVNDKLSPECERKINAYIELVSYGLRFKKDIVSNWLTGYGSSPDDIAPDLKKEYEYNLAGWTISNDAALDKLQNPGAEIKEWMNNLGIGFEDLKTPLVNPFEIDEKICVPTELFERMKNLGLFKLKIQKEFGGLGLNQKEYDRVIRTIIHTYSGTLSGIVSAHSTLGSKPFEYYGDDNQRHHHLPKVARGDGLVSFALTERGSGTDAVNRAATIARLSPDGKKYVLNGSKIYITNAHRSCLILIFAKVDDGDPELKPTVLMKELPFRLSDTEEQLEEKRQRLKKEGLYISKPLELSGIRGSDQAYIEFHNYEIPLVNEAGISNVLGKVGEGTKVIFNSLNAGRAGFGSFCAEAVKHAFRISVLESIQRRRFDEHGGRLADLPQVKKYITEMAIKTEVIDAAVELTTNLIDTYPHMNIIAECAVIKALATEGAWMVSAVAGRVFGGQSLMKGYPIELIMRDMWVPMIVEGVNEALKQHLVGVGVKPLLKAGLFEHLKLALSHLFNYESGGLSVSDMWWLQIKTKIFSTKVRIRGATDIIKGESTLLKQRELLALADEMIEIYGAAGAMLKLRDKNLPEHKKLALEQFIKNLKSRKNNYPASIANAYIKEAEKELNTQRNLEEKIFKNSFTCIS